MIEYKTGDKATTKERDRVTRSSGRRPPHGHWNFIPYLHVVLYFERADTYVDVFNLYATLKMRMLWKHFRICQVISKHETIAP